MLTIPLTLALAFTAAQGTPPRALHPSEIESLKASIGRRVAEVKDAAAGVAFRDMETGDTLYINADEIADISRLVDAHAVPLARAPR